MFAQRRCDGLMTYPLVLVLPNALLSAAAGRRLLAERSERRNSVWYLPRVPEFCSEYSLSKAVRGCFACGSRSKPSSGVDCEGKLPRQMKIYMDRCFNARRFLLCAVAWTPSRCGRRSVRVIIR